MHTDVCMLYRMKTKVGICMYVLTCAVLVVHAFAYSLFADAFFANVKILVFMYVYQHSLLK